VTSKQPGHFVDARIEAFVSYNHYKRLELYSEATHPGLVAVFVISNLLDRCLHLVLRSLNIIAADLRDTRVKSASCLLLGYLNEYSLTENDSSFFSLCCCAWPIGPITSFILCPPVIFQPQRWMPALLGAYELDFYSQVSYHVWWIMDS